MAVGASRGHHGNQTRKQKEPVANGRSEGRAPKGGGEGKKVKEKEFRVLWTVMGVVSERSV